MVVSSSVVLFLKADIDCLLVVVVVVVTTKDACADDAQQQEMKAVPQEVARSCNATGGPGIGSSLERVPAPPPSAKRHAAADSSCFCILIIGGRCRRDGAGRNLSGFSGRRSLL
jgi:hypothetical protein